MLMCESLLDLQELISCHNSLMGPKTKMLHAQILFRRSYYFLFSCVCVDGWGGGWWGGGRRSAWFHLEGKGYLEKNATVKARSCTSHQTSGKFLSVPSDMIL